MRSRSLSLAAAALVSLALVACGGGGSDRGSDGPRPTEPATDQATGPTPSFTGSSDSEYCQLSRSYVEKARQLVEVGSNPDALRQLYRDADRDLKTALDIAPGEIKADLEVVSDGLSALVTALERANYDLARVPPDAFAGITTPQWQAAATRVETYARDVCGVRP